jgi:hypothetical protein
MLAVQIDGYNLYGIDVAEQTDELCLAAVQNNGYALQFVRYQTDRVVAAALNQAGGASYYVRSTGNGPTSIAGPRL